MKTQDGGRQTAYKEADRKAKRKVEKIGSRRNDSDRLVRGRQAGRRLKEGTG
jgi:hypothetical protein